MEDIVRTAAPYCLHPAWTPEVDREMVLLQAQVTYLEAEACVAALQSRRNEVVPPLVDEGQAEDDRGLRLPSQEVQHLNALFLKVSWWAGGCMWTWVTNRPLDPSVNLSIPICRPIGRAPRHSIGTADQRALARYQRGRAALEHLPQHHASAQVRLAAMWIHNPSSGLHSRLKGQSSQPLSP